MAKDNVHSESIELFGQAEQQLDVLLQIKESFFSFDRHEKARRIDAHIFNIVGLLPTLREKPSWSPNVHARRSYVLGRAFDCREEYCHEAEDELSQAVKLDPTQSIYWNAMGHVLWKKGDFDAAADCFWGALEQSPENPASLRELSKMMRQLPVRSSEEKRRLLGKSLELAREAVHVAPLEHESWYVLGNAMVAVFFASSSSSSSSSATTVATGEASAESLHLMEDLMASALSAYGKAEALDGGDRNPDLFFGRAQVHRFSQRFTCAARDYERALSLDPCLPAAADLAAMEAHVAKAAATIEALTRMCEKTTEFWGFASVRVCEREEGEEEEEAEAAADDTEEEVAAAVEEKWRRVSSTISGTLYAHASSQGQRKSTNLKQPSSVRASASEETSSAQLITVSAADVSPDVSPGVLNQGEAAKASSHDMSERPAQRQVALCVVCAVDAASEFPPTALVAVDHSGFFFVLSVYHADAAQFLKERPPGTLVLVSDPRVVDVNYSASSKGTRRDPSSSSSRQEHEEAAMGTQGLRQQQPKPNRRRRTYRSLSFRCLQVKDTSTMLIGGRPLALLSSANDGLLKLSTFDH